MLCAGTSDGEFWQEVRGPFALSFHGRERPGQLIIKIIELSALMGCSAHASALQALTIRVPLVCMQTGDSMQLDGNERAPVYRTCDASP